MDTKLDAMCPHCSSIALTLTAESAAHDVTLIDLIATCGDCGAVLNAFVSVAEMTDVEVDE